ncbi:MarR family transcriptional regulator [Candidatus Woesearchaeota archaeon]|jgi:uncharacterized membrane protein|nr:MarR family transcriptional regulator [Candidatus Woesearchaeota archaeon]MBT6519612.1 MarR family transcriptional regulator [Candidatus Woesearchaeota archaeon]MBT7367527.1 MarR family transcriptional regulator [Candidatus Woesearchaeota archaeon]
MNQKQIGSIIIIIGILLLIFTSFSKIQADKEIMNVVEKTGTCFLEDGTCLHARTSNYFIVGIILSSALIILAIYLVFFDKTQELILKQNQEVSIALRDAKKNDKSKDEFNAFLAGFDEDDRKILAAIKEQDGIKQSTLRFRTGISKSTLSLLLKKLEEKEIISRKPSGKTNEVYLRKKF